MTNRRRRLLILTIFIVVCHTIFTTYWFSMDKPNSERLIIIDNEEETNIPADNNQLQVQLQMEPLFLPLTPNPLTVMQWDDISIPWYFKGGTIRPNNAKVFPSTGMRSSRVWPEERMDDDRVEEQLMFVPSHYQHENSPIKTILLFNYFDKWMVKVGRSEFISKDCPVNRCTIISAKSEAPEVDAIIFRNKFSNPGHEKSDKQIWILSVLESAYYTDLYVPKGMINWTATYRHDSDIAMPYGRWAYYDPRVTQVTQLNQNYARNKTKHVAMFVSNCYTDNNRVLYAKELNNYISVDIYGKCGTIIDEIGSDGYVQMLDQDYKFYLAFENSNCDDYVTEKFFIDGLQHNVLPVVMGGRREDYERMAPERSYIHVDDYESPERLAKYLHRLDTNDDLYNEYFRWKDTGEFIDTKFFCRLCAMLHDVDAPVKHYQDLDDWWAGPGVCDYSPASTQIPPPPTANEQDNGDDHNSNGNKSTGSGESHEWTEY